MRQRCRVVTGVFVPVCSLTKATEVNLLHNYISSQQYCMPPKQNRTAAASRGFLAATRLSYYGNIGVALAVRTGPLFYCLAQLCLSLNACCVAGARVRDQPTKQSIQTCGCA